MIAMLVAALVATPTLMPSGKWQVEYATDSCRSSRVYGESESSTTFVVEREPASDGARLYLMLADRAIPARGKATIRATPQGAERTVNFESWGVPARKQRVVKLWLLADDLAAVIAADTVLFDVGPIELVLASGFTSALAAASSRCIADLERSWGWDPIEEDGIEVPAKGNPASWIRVGDYPLDALRKGQHGTTKVALTIEADGRLSDCKTVVSSGSASLDAATCQAYMTRGRYTPAIGKDGKPMVGHKLLSTNWLPPNRP